MFSICIRRDDGAEVRVRPGGSAERQFLLDIKRRAKERGIGFLKTEAKVLDAVEQAVKDVFNDLKSDVLP